MRLTFKLADFDKNADYTPQCVQPAINQLKVCFFAVLEIKPNILALGYIPAF